MKSSRMSEDFARLFDELSRPVDQKAVRAGFKELASWLGSPRRQWQSGVMH